jgi:hypothetical protein
VQGSAGALAVIHGQGADSAADAPGVGVQVGVVEGEVFGARQEPFCGVASAGERVGDAFDEFAAGEDRRLIESLRGRAAPAGPA